MEPIDVRDVGAAIDRRFSALQVRVVLLCASVALLDGVDTQSIGVAAPALAAKLDLSLPAIGPVLAAALFGAMAGALVCGQLADRFGRKRVLCLATAAFGVCTLLTAQADGYAALVACRFLAGVGLGGAVPCFVSLTSEYVPARRRAVVVSMQYAVFPLGGMAGGFLGAYILRHGDWRTIFLVGGALPIVVAGVLLAGLPESLRFLMARPGGDVAVRAIMRRIAPDLDPARTVFVMAEPTVTGVPLRHLFAGARGRLTLSLWAPFFMGFAMFAIAVLWAPALLRRDGLSPADAAVAVAFNGLGACLGSVAVGRSIERFGAAATLMPCYVAGAAATAMLGQVGASVPWATAAMLVDGLALGAGTSGAIALAAIVYPTAIRSTGVGAAMAAGRLGQALAPLAAGGLLSLDWGSPAIFATLALGPLAAVPFIAAAARAVGDGGAAPLAPGRTRP